MKIINNTAYRTTHLKRAFALALEWVALYQRKYFKRLTVTVRYHRGVSRIGGEAVPGQDRALTMFLPSPRFLKDNWYNANYREAGLDLSQSIVDVFIHELGHCMKFPHKTIGSFDRATIEHLYRPLLFSKVSNKKLPILLTSNIHP